MHTHFIRIEYTDDGRLSTADHQAIARAAVAAVEATRQKRVEAHARSARWAAKWGKQAQEATK
jgi:LmbE family N-acetylglucosaminyl deacetylase